LERLGLNDVAEDFHGDGAKPRSGQAAAV
jgi:hypothetical protein